MFQKKNAYPVIFVPGVVSYSGKVKTVIESMDLDVYTPSFGLTSGIWDRACELYAQIKGGTVDYGAAHAEKYGTERFGKTYEGFVENWSSIDKVTLIAHGAGVPVARLLVYLMAYGSKKEQAAGGDISPLFQGGHSKAVHALVSLAGINEGTTLFQAIESTIPGITKKALSVAFAADALTGGLGVKKYGPSAISDLAVDEYMATEQDNLFWDLSTEGMAKWNKMLRINPDCYYVAYTGEVTKNIYDLLKPITDRPKKHGNPLTAKRAKGEITKDISLPTLAAGLCAPTAALMGTYHNYVNTAPLATTDMHANDGMVNTDFSLAPATESYSKYLAPEECVPGTWYQMPVEKKNHFAFLGLMQRPDTFRNDTYDMVKMVCNFEIV